VQWGAHTHTHTPNHSVASSMIGRSHILDLVVGPDGVHTVAVSSIEFGRVYPHAWKVLDDWLHAQVSTGRPAMVPGLFSLGFGPEGSLAFTMLPPFLVEAAAADTPPPTPSNVFTTSRTAVPYVVPSC
jgi:hypothetical protein